MAGVRFEHIYKRYGSVEILRDFHLEIRDREFLVLVGPSGCGKSTTLRLIAGLEDTSTGNLYIGDRLVNGVPPKDRDIAMVFQNYALYPHLSVRENMGFSLKLQGIPKAEIARKIHDVAKILALETLLDRKPKELSGGQRQRVAMGRAIVRHPQVFLFDEPLSNLDAKLRVQMRVEISQLHRQLQTTIVYVTHDQVEAMTLADRIVVMKDGVIQQIGAPMELYDKPKNAFVGGFIGSPTMNQIQAQVSLVDGRPGIHTEGLAFPLPSVDSSLQPYPGQSVLIGIRPEHLKPLAQPSTGACLRAGVDVIEPMGNESFVYFTLQGKGLIARAEGLPPIKEGQEAYFQVDVEHLHLFNQDGTQRLN